MSLARVAVVAARRNTVQTCATIWIFRLKTLLPVCRLNYASRDLRSAISAKAQAQPRERSLKPARPVAGLDRYAINKASSRWRAPVALVAGRATSSNRHAMPAKAQDEWNASGRWRSRFRLASRQARVYASRAKGKRARPGARRG